MLSGPGGNIGVSVGSDGILILDDKFGVLPTQPNLKAHVFGRVDRADFPRKESIRCHLLTPLRKCTSLAGLELPH